MKVILIGYMGSGKSTIGRKLTNVLDYNFIDLDDYVVEKEKMSIPEIFDKKGEVYFRKKEYYYLQEILQKNDNLVISLGGGTPCYGDNMKTILNSDNSRAFYLKGSIPFLTKRLFSERGNRPLISHLNTTEELQEFIGKHLFERGFYYNQASNIIDIDDKAVMDIIEEIVLELF